MPDGPLSATELPPVFADWFSSRGWRPRAHQLECLEAARAGRSHLLIAPTGGGKTLAGFLPSLIELAAKSTLRDALSLHPEEDRRSVTKDEAKDLLRVKKSGALRIDANSRIRGGVHTLYISPLKALAVDIARNVEAPVREMGLPITLETRTGDTPSSRRQRQRFNPPDILLTTPEQVALLLANKDAAQFFRHLKTVIIDELHSLIGVKRGALLALGLARLHHLAPGLRLTGLSATVPDPAPLLDFLTPQNGASEEALLIRAKGHVKPNVRVLDSENRIPWSGHSARHAWEEVYEAIKASKMTLVFVNTRSQAEMTFQALWRMNDDNLAIALHHGSLDVEKRRKVEAAMTKGTLRAVVCTSTLDLGIDWGEVDLVIQIGAPKGASRLTQRIGRANHRMDEPSSALLIPGNRFEVLECLAARDALDEGALDGDPPREGALDILAQHILGMASAEPFDADALYAEVTSAAPYRDLKRHVFEEVLEFVATGGYALKRYERYRRVVKTPEGLYRVRSPQVAQQYRMNVGAIVESPTFNVRLVSGKGPRRMGRKLGTLEEWFIEGLSPGDTFLFAGEILRLEGVDGVEAYVSRAPGEDPRVPSWNGGKFPLTTYLAERVRRMIHDTESWRALPNPLRDWLEIQREVSLIPGPDELLVETFPHNNRHFLVCYPFDGRLAHQTLGTLITRRLERMGMQPLGFTPTEYSLSVWARRDLSEIDLDQLFDEEMMGDDLEEWLQESVLMRATFRDCAVIAGLIERRYPGQEKSGRQVTFSADLIYNVLREHEPNHVLLRAAWADAAGGYLDLKRLSSLLARVKGHIRHARLDRVSPLAVPVMLEINKTAIYGEAQEEMLREASNALIAEAMRRGVR